VRRWVLRVGQDAIDVEIEAIRGVAVEADHDTVPLAVDDIDVEIRTNESFC